MVDPLGHCQDAQKYFKPDLIQGRSLLAIAQMYETYGVRPVSRTDIKNVTFYVMSSNDQAGEDAGLYWTSAEAFPDFTPTKIYFHADGSASSNAPNDGEGADSTSFVYDPANPTYGIGGNNLDIPCGPYDQTELDARSDTIKFQTATLTEEMPLTGPLFANLFVSSDALDTDFTVRIMDVYPTGEARLLQDNAVRMRWREGGLSPVYMTKGEIYSVRMTLWNTSYVVAPGHALRVSISSSNSPRFSINRNNGLVLADPNYPGENITANNVVYHSSKYPSSFELPLVSKKDLPQLHNIKAQVSKAYPSVDFDAILKAHPDVLAEMQKPMRDAIKKKVHSRKQN